MGRRTPSVSSLPAGSSRAVGAGVRRQENPGPCVLPGAPNSSRHRDGDTAVGPALLCPSQDVPLSPDLPPGP